MTKKAAGVAVISLLIGYLILPVSAYADTLYDNSALDVFNGIAPFTTISRGDNNYEGVGIELTFATSSEVHSVSLLAGYNMFSPDTGGALRVTVYDPSGTSTVRGNIVGFTETKPALSLPDQGDPCLHAKTCPTQFTVASPVTLPPGSYYFVLEGVNNGHQTYAAAWVMTSSLGSEVATQYINAGGRYGDSTGTPIYMVINGTQSTPLCTVNCYDNVLFLPGIEASRLYDFLGQQRWEPHTNADVEAMYLNSDGTSAQDGISTKDVIDEVNVLPSPLRANIYKSFLVDLNTWKNADHLIEDYAAVPYDWRLSLDDILKYGNQSSDGRVYYSGGDVFRATTTPYIIQTLRNLAETSRTGKVTIVAHSNGGLVAKALLKRLQDTHDPLLDKIDNLVLVAVPQTGTPLAIGALLDGTKQSQFPVLDTQTARTFAKNAPAAYQLLPTAVYFNGLESSVSTPPISFASGSSTKLFTDTYGSSIDTHDKLLQFIAGAEGRSAPSSSNVTYPQIGNQALLSASDSLHVHLDTWTPPSSIHVYQIAGWGNDTVGTITYKPGGFFHCLLNNPCLDEDLTMIADGDGTVVVPSALAMSTSTSNVGRYWVDLTKFNNSHANILEISSLRNFIENIITIGQNAPLTLNISTSTPPHGNAKKRLRYYLHSPLTLELFDQSGNHLGISSSTGLFEDTIPGAQYDEIGDIKYASVPEGTPVTLTMRGQSTGGFTLKIEEGQESNVLGVTAFADIPSATSTVATMNFPDGTFAHAGALAIDINGDGTVDYNVTPANGLATVLYRWNGFLQPINDTTYQQNLSPSIFKAGSTVPVKFQLRKLDGTITQASILPLWLPPQQGAPLSATSNESPYTDSASTGTTYKWDPTAKQYIYNWSTKGLSAGYWYKIYAKLDDGMMYSVTVGLR